MKSIKLKRISFLLVLNGLTSFPFRNIPIDRSVLRIPRNVLFILRVSIPCLRSIKGSAISCIHRKQKKWKIWPRVFFFSSNHSSEIYFFALPVPPTQYSAKIHPRQLPIQLCVHPPGWFGYYSRGRAGERAPQLHWTLLTHLLRVLKV